MLGRIAVIVAAIVMSEFTAEAAPIFYLSTAADAASAPSSGIPNIFAFPGSSAAVNIFANSDLHLSGVSLDLIATGKVKFTGITVANPGTGGSNRWFLLDGPQMVSDSQITSIGGGAIPGLSGNGIGQGSAEGPKVLLATVHFQALGYEPGGAIYLRVGTNAIAAWDGTFPTVFFGTATGSGVNGGVPGGMGIAAFINTPEPATLPLFCVAMASGCVFTRHRYVRMYC
jgi:hypothetical protein